MIQAHDIRKVKVPSANSRGDHNYEAKSLGILASRELIKTQEGYVIGTTSKGFYIFFSNGRIIFVSFDSYRSPFTINLQCVPDNLRQIQRGSGVRSASGKLFLPSVATVISTSSGELWAVPRAPDMPLQKHRRFDQLRTICTLANAMNRMSPFGSLLPFLMQPAPGEDAADECQRILLAKLLKLRKELKQNLWGSVPTIIQFLGWGKGLTPSGDDFVTGLLLALNRWPKELNIDKDIGLFNLEIVRAAARKTTAISATLIECATRAESDERLVNVVDCVFAGNPSVLGCIFPLLEWGASSGIDTLAGIGIVAYPF
jgi:hypothetical protein